MRCARQTPHHPPTCRGPLLPHCATHLRHEFDVVSLVTFKIVFNYFLTSSSVKSVGRPSLPTPLPLPLPPSPRHWRLWGGSRPRAKGAIVAAWWAPALPTHTHTNNYIDYIQPYMLYGYLQMFLRKQLRENWSTLCSAAAAAAVDCAAFINFKLVKIEKQVEIITAKCND